MGLRIGLRVSSGETGHKHREVSKVGWKAYKATDKAPLHLSPMKVWAHVRL